MSDTDPVILGNAILLTTTVGQRDVATGLVTPVDDPDLVLHILKPDGTEDTLTQPDSEVIHDTVGQYHATYGPTAQGHYVWRWDGGATLQSASEGTFDVTSSFQPRVTDPTDIRVLGPMVQRALEGVTQPDWTLTPDQIKDVTADAMAQILLYTGSVFGMGMEVTATDPVTLAPDEYRTDRALTLPESTVIASQAALNYFFYQYKGIKVSESIGDEASTWSYALSPNLLIAQLGHLQDARDKAIEAIEASSPNMEGYVSFLGIRDTAVSRIIEPWVYGHSEGYGVMAGGIEADPRFGSLPYGAGDW